MFAAAEFLPDAILASCERSGIALLEIVKISICGTPAMRAVCAQSGLFAATIDEI